MIIYVYGSDDFRKDIHELLEHSNIKFRLDENGEVIDLSTLEDLKNAIEDNPKNIYLIDDSKIIKKKSLLNDKFKFLKPKDGIGEDFLLDHGIGDISVNSIEELSKHIKSKLDSIVDEKESENIQDSIVEIVEDAYENSDNDKEYIQLDDELKELLSHRNTDKEEPQAQVEQIDDISSMLEEVEPISDEKENPLMNDPLLNELDSMVEEDEENLQEDQEALKDLSFEEDSGKIDLINEEKDENKLEQKGSEQGEVMADEFSEFDSLNEADLLAALDITDSKPVETKASNTISTEEVKKSEEKQNLDLGSSSADDIAKLISQLLNNKTLEITIKVKD
ncbi:hypothetical protein [Halarcobacter anaerophilus]|uniref:hypothetical protein n=1 Tax=Halarcobacter anaerophilus TaxID=877500 RepID=UPI0005CA6D61|nr:hypothetical protein [Halarcobacter anaerophilus]